jgi:exopolysaccharide biosynthesis polyprenyl glycosylphosphotransferase
MRGWRRDVRLLTMLVDLLAIIAAFEGTVYLRVSLNNFFTAQLTVPQVHYLAPPLGLVLILWAVTGSWIRLYRPRRGPLMLSTVGQVIEAMGLVLVLAIVATFFLRDFGEVFSRSFVILLGPLGVAAMLAGRATLMVALRAARGRALGAQRILIVGRGRAAESLIRRIEKTAAGAVRICGVVTSVQGEGEGVLGNPVPVLGSVADLRAVINQHAIDRVIAVESEISAEALQSCISVCTRMGVPVNHTAGMIHQASTRIELTEVGTVRLVELRGVEFTRFQELSKRAFDLAFAGVLLILLSPLFLTLAVIIKVTSPGPILYVAPRVGLGGRYFRFFKFRTMVRGADHQRVRLAGKNEKKGHLFKITDDPRVTGVGRFMRRFSLDELPQLLNVVMGDMSLVGPRPLPSADLDPDGLSTEHRAWARDRAKVRPGITGLWQVRGRSDVRFEEMIRFDILYVRSWSLRLDLQILLETIPAALGGRGAC